MKINSRKKEIIEVASRLFKERGYNAVTMRDIAQEMGIKAASLYNHIKGKQEILSTIIMEIAHEFIDGMNKIMIEKSSSITQIRKLLELHIEITINHSDGIAALNNDWMHLNEKDRKEFIKMREDYEENFRKIIMQGINDKEIKPRHPEVILFSILSTLRALYLWYQKRGKLDANILKKDMVEVFLKGIVNK